MKCPKCDYLGFETGDRCKNCGYDFSLMSAVDSDPEPPDYEIHPAAVDDVPVYAIDDRPTHQDLVDDLDTLSLTPEALFEEETPSGLPLFTAQDESDDEPLIKFPAAPRPPLAVRRAPDAPCLRAVPRPTSRPSPAPVLQFSEDVIERPAPPEPKPAAPEQLPSGTITGRPTLPGPRVTAVLIDHLILIGIDAAVIYFTARMAGLAMGEWTLLPIAPMLTFLALLKVSYFYAFTAVGGQTIGKMAVGTCVVADNGDPVNAAQAMRRTSAGVVSFLCLGLGFIPALFGDHRALHDRLAGTRVIRLRSV